LIGLFTVGPAGCFSLPVRYLSANIGVIDEELLILTVMLSVVMVTNLLVLPAVHVVAKGLRVEELEVTHRVLCLLLAELPVESVSGGLHSLVRDGDVIQWWLEQIIGQDPGCGQSVQLYQTG
jgi:small neutral amino acid transporter SnatA (MarC family)